MAELLCGAIPGICGTVAARPHRINGGIGVSAPGFSTPAEIFFAAP
jgi:hypothetical protein